MRSLREGSHSRVKASLARFKMYLSPSNLVSSASRDAESSWLSNIAVSRDFFSALEQSNKKAFEKKYRMVEKIIKSNNPPQTQFSNKSSLLVDSCYMRLCFRNPNSLEVRLHQNIQRHLVLLNPTHTYIHTRWLRAQWKNLHWYVSVCLSYWYMSILKNCSKKIYTYIYTHWPLY